MERQDPRKLWNVNAPAWTELFAPALASIGIDLLTVYVTNPFNEAEGDYDPDFGGC